MTEPSTPTDPSALPESDEGMHDFAYGHGRMPFFMKVVWVAFLIFATWYTVVNLLSALAEETGA